MAQLIRLRLPPPWVKILARMGGAALASTAAVAIVWGAFLCPARAADSDVPRFVVDPFWPKPLPDRSVTGAVGGVCVDGQDHVFGVNRSESHGDGADRRQTARARRYQI